MNDSFNPSAVGAPPMSAKVWFITGCSTGFGRSLAARVLASGAQAVLTARDPASLADLAQAGGSRCLTLALDVRDAGQAREAVRQAEQRFGRIDVLVNNAGYGYQATVEEAEDAQIRAVFETNVFGVFNVTRAVVPGMRRRRSGCILSIGSVAGLVGFPGSGYYAATKHAIEGWSDALAAELKPLGVRVACIEPGPFRTDFASRSLQQTPVVLPEYAATAGVRLQATRAQSGSQPGDPERAADILLQWVERPEIPRHLILGAGGVDGVVRALQGTLAEIEASRPISASADFPA
jgi:NAD(P)-dependent dehydrogenase (short-subunit alcohol dehydrogenase family)